MKIVPGLEQLTSLSKEQQLCLLASFCFPQPFHSSAAPHSSHSLGPLLTSLTCWWWWLSHQINPNDHWHRPADFLLSGKFGPFMQKIRAVYGCHKRSVRLSEWKTSEASSWRLCRATCLSANAFDDLTLPLRQCTHKMHACLLHPSLGNAVVILHIFGDAAPTVQWIKNWGFWWVVYPCLYQLQARRKLAAFPAIKLFWFRAIWFVESAHCSTEIWKKK